MKRVVYVLVFVFLVSCNTEKPPAFPLEALNEQFLTIDEKPITFKEIIEKNKGKKMMIEACASWCSECISGIPTVKKLKAENPDVVFIFLSIDKTIPQWKKGIDRFFNIEGQHYFLPSALKGGFATSLGIKDIPSYMVVNELGIVSLASATEPGDPRIAAALKE